MGAGRTTSWVAGFCLEGNEDSLRVLSRSGGVICDLLISPFLSALVCYLQLFTQHVPLGVLNKFLFSFKLAPPLSSPVSLNGTPVHLVVQLEIEEPFLTSPL